MYINRLVENTRSRCVGYALHGGRPRAPLIVLRVTLPAVRIASSHSYRIDGEITWMMPQRARLTTEKTKKKNKKIFDIQKKKSGCSAHKKRRRTIVPRTFNNYINPLAVVFSAYKFGLKS